MSRARKIVGLVSAIAIAACVDLAAPKGAPASISQLKLPAFFVVQGDTMRDTLGRVVPPAIIAYDATGGVLTSFRSTFFITDSLQQLHFTATDSASVSNAPTDTAGAVAHVFGQISSLQTATQTVYVTVRPDTLERTDTTTLKLTLKTSARTRNPRSRRCQSTWSFTAQVLDPCRASSFAFRSSRHPRAKAASPVAYLVDNSNTVYLAGQSAVDTGKTYRRGVANAGRELFHGESAT